MRWLFRIVVALAVLVWKGLDSPTVEFGPETEIVTSSLRASRGASLNLGGGRLILRRPGV